MGPLSFSEILVVAVFALIVFGPDKLPGLLRSAGRFLGDMRRMASELRTDLRESIDVEPDQEPDPPPTDKDVPPIDPGAAS